LLRARKIQVPPVSSLCFHSQIRSKKQNGNIRSPRKIHGTSNHRRIGRLNESSALLVLNLHVGAQSILQTLKRANLSRWGSVIVSRLIGSISRRPDDSNTLQILFFQRKEI